MGKSTATGMCLLAFALLAGCVDYSEPRRTASIRQSAPAAKPKPAMSEPDRARAAQEKQCAQRHVDRANGVLYETTEEKRDRDQICGAFYRGS